jgi:tRNA/tmRNA/rRNA uracil-C5-methylase (TrmA/RlmC/RlmD family)
MSEVFSPSQALSVGQALSLSITDLAFGGEGVGRLGEFVVFVPFVITGETVEVEITEVKKRFARAKLVRMLQASPHRVTPQCRYFGECGGCQYQHIDYALQLEFKRKQMSDLFERIGGFAPGVVQPVVPCPQPYGYRNRIMVRSQWNKPEEKLNIGFLRHDNRLVLDVEECPIAEPALNERIRQVRANPPSRGGLKVVLRVIPEGWTVPPDSFFQNNFFLLPKLVDLVRERLREGGSRFLVDAYCGVGFFAIELADQIERFLGVELDQQAIKAARQNAATHRRMNGDFIEGHAERVLPAILGRFPASATTVLIDPPRTGCPAPALQSLRQNRPAQVIYVSCHPATLARDLKALCADGFYELQSVTPLDMFPQTQHVECVTDVRARRC